MVTNASTAVKLAFLEKSYHSNLSLVHLPFPHTCGMKCMLHDFLSIVKAFFILKTMPNQPNLRIFSNFC